MMNKDTTYGNKNEDASTEFYDLTTRRKVKKSKMSEKDFKDFVRFNNRFKKRRQKNKKNKRYVHKLVIHEEKQQSKDKEIKVTGERPKMSHKDEKFKQIKHDIQSFDCAKKYKSTDLTRAVEINDEIITKVINESIMTAQVDNDEIIAKVINESIMTAQVDESRRKNNIQTIGRYHSDMLFYENEAKEKIVKYIVSLLDVDQHSLMKRDLNYLIELSRNIEDKEMEEEKRRKE